MRVGLRLFPLLVLLVLIAQTLPAFSQSPALTVRGHRGPVSAMSADESGTRIMTAGEDGFVVEWNVSEGRAVDRFQLSPYGIVSLSLRPGSRDIAIAESDGLGLYRVSAWNMDRRERLFSLRFKDPVSYLAYSASGSFIAVARSAQTGIVLIDSVSGSILRSPETISSTLSYVATGKSERTMIAYSTGGELSYWDLAAGDAIRVLKAPANIANPVLFANNRYLAGFDGQGIVIIDALTGLVVSRAEASASACLVAMPGPSEGLMAVEAGEYSVRVRTFAATAFGLQESGSVYAFLEGAIAGLSASPDGTSVFVPLSHGDIARIDVRTGNASTMISRPVLPVSDASAYEGGLFVLTGSGLLALPSSPQDYSQGQPFLHSAVRGEDRLIAVSEAAVATWSADGKVAPLLRRLDGSGDLELLPPGSAAVSAASALGGRILFLDASGTLRVVETMTGTPVFSFSSVGLLDAAFRDERRLLVGKSVSVAPAAPLLSIEMATGETVPVDLGGSAAVRVLRGSSGTCYAVIADEDEAGRKTSIVKIDFRDPAASTALMEYRAEDVSASIAETSASVCATLGGDGAFLFGAEGFKSFERTAALPDRVFEAAGYALCLDSDGGLVWHDPVTGRTVAELRFTADGWEMTRNGEILTGNLF